MVFFPKDAPSGGAFSTQYYGLFRTPHWHPQAPRCGTDTNSLLSLSGLCSWRMRHGPRFTLFCLWQPSIHHSWHTMRGIVYFLLTHKSIVCWHTMRGIVYFLLTHIIRTTRQDRRAGLNKARDTRRHQHTALPATPWFPPPGPSHLLTTLGSQSELWRFLFQKNKPICVLQKLRRL